MGSRDRQTELGGRVQLYWLIERGSPAEFLVDHHYGSLTWTSDAHTALKFPNEAMARDFASRTPVKLDEYRVTEHGFIDDPPSESTGS